MNAGPLIRAYTPRPDAGIRLFCFPAAGTGASFFQQLAAALPADVEVCGVEYPGRGARAGEKLIERIGPLVSAIGRCMEEYLEKPFAFLGYSMGALVCYELARVLGSRKRQPEHVFLAAARAPRIAKSSPISRLPDGEFLEEVIKYGGMPPEILEDPDLLGRSLAVLRADFALCEDYSAREDEPLRCPLTVLGGQDDASVPLASLEAWSSYAGLSFSSRIFAGDHFFIRREQAAVAGLLAKELRPLMGAPETLRESEPRPAPAQNKRAALAELLRAKLDRPRPCPLSLAQQAFFLEQQMDPASTALNVPLVFRVRAELSTSLLTRTLEILTERHPMLRTVFSKTQTGEVRQQAQPAGPLTLPPVRDLPGGPGEDAFAAVLAASRKQSALPFDLESGPLYRFEVVRVSPAEFYFLATMHGILLDRFAIATLRREIAIVYGSLERRIDHGLPPLGAAYEQFVEQKRESPAGAKPQEDLAYWKRRLRGVPARLALPGARPRGISRGYRGGSVESAIPEELAGSLRELSRREGSSLANVFLTALYVLLHRLTGATELVVGTTCPNREQAERGGPLGLFGTMLPLRADVSGNPSFSELLRRVAQGAREDRAHAGVPLSRLAGSLGGSRQASFQASFHMDELDELGDASGSEGAHEPESVTLATGVNAFAKAELSFDISGIGRGLFLLAEYDGEVWEREQVERMVARYRELLRFFAADGGAPIADGSAGGASRAIEMPAGFSPELRRHAC